MLSREDFYMIKQMRQQGAYIVDIATQIGCSERTVRRYLKYPEPPARKIRHKMVKLKPFMDYINMRLAENVWNSEVIFAEIKAMGYTGGRSMLRYYIQPKRKMRLSKRTARFETQPGYQLQHNWGEVEVEVAGQRCKVNFAVNTLGGSRCFHVFAVPKQDAEHTYESLVRAFRYFGGCVKTVLVDNQKAAVLKNNNGKVVFNSGFLLLADHYNFLPRACRPRRARTKGKVERMM
ncbi:IS21 family transposase, partial [Escherichia coli]|nr:IS21 family transposase [Escherichia coli]